MPMTRHKLSNHDFSQYGMEDWWTLEDSILDSFISEEQETKETRDLNRYWRGSKPRGKFVKQSSYWEELN